MESWFKAYRKIFENGIWKNPFDFRLFFWFVGHAVYDDKGQKYGNVIVDRGQYLRSYRKLQEDLEYIENRQIKIPSLSTISRSIDRLVEQKMISQHGTELGTLFTIINFDKYQAKEFRNETFTNEIKEVNFKPGTQHGTLAEQQRNNNKNDKKEKNIYNEIFDFWISQNIYNHHSLTDKHINKIKTALKNYTPNKIKLAISTYKEILESDEYYFSYRWTLNDFLQRGLEKFADPVIARQNYFKKNSFLSNNQNNNNPQSKDILI